MSFRTPLESVRVTRGPPGSLVGLLFGKWDVEAMQEFMDQRHLPFSVLLILSYCTFVYYGQRFMADRKPFKLDKWLIAWNVALSVFSGFSVYRLIPEIVDSVKEGGIIGSLCYNYNLYTNPYSGYWTWMFVMSKAPELVDTIFLVLRKRPVIFLHWYHHSVTYLAGAVFFSSLPPWIRWLQIINLGIHTGMYFYFGMRSAGIRVPNAVAMFITAAQIIQFSIGFLLLARFFSLHMNLFGEASEHPDCWYREDMIVMGSVVLATYLFLFSKFFRDAYITGKKKRAAAKVDENSNLVESKEKKEISVEEKKDQ